MKCFVLNHCMISWCLAKGYDVYSSVFFWNLRQACKLFMLVGRSYVRPLTGVCSTRSGGE